MGFTFCISYVSFGRMQKIVSFGLKECTPHDANGDR